MMKNIKKSVIAGALALAMVGTAVPVTANASTVNNAGTYTTASMTRTASGSGTVTGTAKGSNNTNASKYVDVYVKAGTSLASATIRSSSCGVTNAYGSRSTTAYSISNSHHCYGVSVIHGGASSSASTIETRIASN